MTTEKQAWKEIRALPSETKPQEKKRKNKKSPKQQHSNQREQKLKNIQSLLVNINKGYCNILKSRSDPN